MNESVELKRKVKNGMNVLTKPFGEYSSTLDEMWEMMEDQVAEFQNLFLKTPVEDKSSAMMGKATFGKNVIAYRAPYQINENRDLMLKRAKHLLPSVKRSIEQRALSPKFVEQWARLHHYAGYIQSFIFPYSAPHTSLRGSTVFQGKSLVRRVWIAKEMVPLLEKGLSRAAAEKIVVIKIKKIIEMGRTKSPYDKAWFEDLLSDGTGARESDRHKLVKLKKTFGDGNFGAKEMKNLYREGRHKKLNLP